MFSWRSHFYTLFHVKTSKSEDERLLDANGVDTDLRESKKNTSFLKDELELVGFRSTPPLFCPICNPLKQSLENTLPPPGEEVGGSWWWWLVGGW